MRVATAAVWRLAAIGIAAMVSTTALAEDYYVGQQTQMVTEKIRDELAELRMLERKDPAIIAESKEMRQVLTVALKLARDAEAGGKGADPEALRGALGQVAMVQMLAAEQGMDLAPVTAADVISLARLQETGNPWLRTSARLGENVEEAFSVLLQLMEGEA